MKFEDPPTIKGLGRKIPPARLEALDVLRQNPNRWALYEPSDGDPFKSPRTITQQALKGTGGFTPKGAWKTATRGRDVYLMFSPETEGRSGATEEESS